jgi:hypothetical protein
VSAAERSEHPAERAAGSRPTLVQRIAYSYGKVLPPAMNDWVRDDLTGKGAQRRTLVRVGIPAILIVAPLWLIPASVGMHLAMSSLLLLPFVYFTHALDKVWRAHRLRQHGLDPELVDERARSRDAHIREDYRRRHGHREDGHPGDGNGQD